MSADLHYLELTEIGRRIQAREISSVAVTQAIRRASRRWTRS